MAHHKTSQIDFEDLSDQNKQNILLHNWFIIYQDKLFQKCLKKKEESKKQINSVVKEKFKKLFQRYLNFSDNEKKAFFMNVLEKQLINQTGVFKNQEKLKSQMASSKSNSNQLLSESDKLSFNIDNSIKFYQIKNKVKQNHFQSIADCNIKQALRPTIINLETFGEQSLPRTQNNFKQSFSDNTSMKTEKEITYE